MPIGIVEVHQKNMIITKSIRPFLVFVNEKVLKSQISNFFDSWRHMLRDFDFDYSYCIVLPLCVSMNMATIPHLSSPTVGNCSTTSWPKFSDFCWPFYQRISALQFVDNRLQVLSARSLFINQLFCCTHRTFLPASGGGEEAGTSAQTRLESMEFERIYMHFVEIIKKTDWSAVSWISVGINTPVVCSKRVEHRKNLRRSGNNNKQTIRWRRLFFSRFLKIAKSNVRSADYFLVSFFFFSIKKQTK